jgi:hemerythrin
LATSFGPHLEIGVPEIDAQHREIFGTLRTLDAALAAHDEDAADLALRHLSRYVLVHFETEERWMRRTGYPRLREHVR